VKSQDSRGVRITDLYIDDDPGDVLSMADRGTWVSLEAGEECGPPVEIYLDANHVDEMISWLTAWKKKGGAPR